ncbi:MAG: ABC transporter ATP-binding protein/permease [Pseudomonadota bacterium]
MAKTKNQNNIDAIETADGGIGIALARVLGILLGRNLAKWRPIMLLAVAVTLISRGVSVIAPLYLEQAINALSDGVQMDEALTAALIFLGLFAGGRFLAIGLRQAGEWLFAPVSQDAQRVMAVDTFRHAQHLSLGFHQTRRTGALNRIIERGTVALDYILRFMSFNIGPTLIELCLVAGVLALTYDAALAVIAVLTVASYAVFTFFMTEWRVRQRRRLNEADTEWRARAVDSMTNFETVKAFAAEDRETGRYNEAIQEYNRHFVVTARSLNLLNTGQEFITNGGLFAMMGFTAWQVAEGQLEIGAIAAVMMLMMNLYRPLGLLGWAWREIKQGAVDLEKLFGLLAMESDVPDSTDAEPLAKPEGHVSFSGVSFAHDGRTAGLQDVSFDVPAGKSVAFVGTSGAGKSTLLKLLFRFYDVDKGQVAVDGRDVRDLKQMSLRRALGLVPQDVVLFNDTIKANIAYAHPEASMDALRNAARRAQLLDFIESLPEGWDTRVGERGLKLSGGEKQRVGIARVILSDPAILVLDEATSALDSGTEAAVQEALEAASRGRTTLMVAHRLSTVQNADEIIVLQQGQIIERGTHGALLASGGEYAEMWKRQSQDAKVVEHVG